MTNEELVLLYQHADNKKYYIEQLYLQNKGLIADIANHFKAYSDFEDLMQEGYFGLVKAAESWNEEKGALFTTYAFQYIRAYIQRYINDNGFTVRIPVYQKSMILKMKKAVNAYYQSNGHEPNIKELSKLLKLSQEQTEKLISDALFLEMKSSNESISTEDDSIMLEDTFSDPVDRIEQLEDDMQNEQLKKILWGMVDSLPDPEQSIILHEKYEGNLSFEELSQKLNITNGHIRNSESKAMRELRKAHNRKKLRPFLPEDKIYSISLNYSSYGYFKNTWTSAPERAVLMAEN